VLAVLSVDGVNAISGETAGSSQAGYVLEPWQQVEIRGWRKSYADIAEFYFTDLPDAYAARTGRPQNVGVIGVAAFREKRRAPIAYTPTPSPPPYYPAPYAEREQGAAKSAAESSNRAADAAAGGALSRRDSAPTAQAQQIGTGHGARRYDPVTQTEFERASWRPNQRVSLYYDSYQALVAKGVIRERYYDYARSPDPFPSGFAPDPN